MGEYRRDGDTNLMGDLAVLSITGAGNEVSRERRWPTGALSPPIAPANQFGNRTRQVVSQLPSSIQSANNSFREIEAAVGRVAQSDPDGVRGRWLTISKVNILHARSNLFIETIALTELQ